MASSENPFSRLVNQNSPTAVARLAVLEPSADPDSPIRLTLADAPLASTSYECISYDREDESGTVTVLVDDAEQEIPVALADALRIFRRREQPRKVWADLLVGRTVAERNAQGPVMRQILSHADKTLCWLGPGGEKAELTSLAFDTLREMANRYLQACLHVGLSQDTSIARATLQQIDDIRTRLHDCPYDDLHSFNFELWKVIDGILGAKYWVSVHSIPDIVSAKLPIIVLGRSNMRWPNYIAAGRCYQFMRAKFFGAVPLLPSVQKGCDIANQIEIAERRKRLRQSIELFPMIQTARDCGAKDPREHVFAMLKIATPSARIEFHDQGPQPLPTIDYSKTAQQVFTEAARYTILERQDLLVWFGECPPCQRVLKGLPSWVPDFGTTSPKGRVGSPNGGLRQWWEALKPRIKPITVSDDNALRVQAHGLARVAHVSPVFDAGNLTRLCYTEFAKLPEPESWETAEQRNERFWRTLVTNSGGFEAQHSFADPSPLKADVGLSFRSLMAQERILALLDCTPAELRGNMSPELRARLQANPEVQSLVPLTGKDKPYENLLRHYALGRRFFRTEDGRFGMTATEDVVAVDGDLSQERKRQQQRSGGSSSTTNSETTTAEPSSNDSNPSATTTDDTQPGDGGGPLPRPNMGRLMADPMARAMMESFQQYLTIRDPTAANLVSGMIRGDIPGMPREEDGGPQQAAPEPGGRAKGSGRATSSSPSAESSSSGEPAAAAAASSSPPSSNANSTPLAVDDATYEFVGDCYLYGAMDGEDFLAQSTITGKKFFRVDRSKLIDIRIV
ncbi:uncharacterized protein PG998_009268 [Apiospora kogelbergensis]|uniref:uncharacterized protein n=1 Tax=Apiospora kogelbergensis TaxID=1337665 RepID=UPI0031314B5D